MSLKLQFVLGLDFNDQGNHTTWKKPRRKGVNQINIRSERRFSLQIYEFNRNELVVVSLQLVIFYL